MNFGGPVWHASVAGSSDARRLKTACISELAGVGDTALGEWWETHNKAVHLRRRLSNHEMEQIGPVLDVRGTSEALRRFDAIKHLLPAAAFRIAAEELPDIVRSALYSVWAANLLSTQRPSIPDNSQSRNTDQPE